MKTQHYLESKKYSTLVFIACFIAYAASYVGRINYSAALPDILEEGLFTKSQAGIIGSAFFIVYGFFQIINGFLGDKISPFKMIILGTFLSAGANTVMTFCTTNVSMPFWQGHIGPKARVAQQRTILHISGKSVHSFRFCHKWHWQWER